MLCEPLVALLPVHPFDAMQPVASVELQVSVDDPPLMTLVGFAVSVTVGTGTTVTCTVCEVVPCPFVQLSV